MPQTKNVTHITAFLLLLIAAAYIVTKVMLPWGSAVDFRYFWLAGDLWNSGQSPYGPSFLNRARDVFDTGNVPPQWGYPPHFRPVSAVLALAPVDVSAHLWRAFGVLAILAGVLLLIAGIQPWRQIPIWGYMLLLTAALTMSASATSITIGQSAPLIFLGYALFVCGYLRDRPGMLILAMVIIMVKPTYGAIPCFFLLFQLRYLGTVIIAAILTLLLSAWGLWGQDLQVVIGQILEAFASYKDAPVNGAAEMTGLRHLVYAAGFGDRSQLVFVLTGCGLACLLGATLNRRHATDPARLRAVVLLGLLTVVFGPLHTYDGFFVLAIAIPALALSRVEIAAGAVLFLATWRSNNLATVTGLRLPDSTYFPGSTIEALAACGILVLLLIVQAARGRRPEI